MSQPTEPHLGDVLHRATEHVAVPGLAGEAWGRARRRRVRRRAAAASLTAAAVAAAVVVGTTVVRGGGDAVPAPQPTAPTSAPTEGLMSEQGQAIPDDVVQPFWDPRDAFDLPQRSSSVPRTITVPQGSPSIDGAPLGAPAVLALVDGAGATHVLGADGSRRVLAGTSASRTPPTLSPDGTMLAQHTAAGLAVWRLLDGTATTLAYPGAPPTAEEEWPIRWHPDGERVLVVRGRGGWSMGLDGSTEVMPYPSNRFNAELRYDETGVLVELAYDQPPYLRRQLVEWDGAQEVSRRDTEALEHLLGASVSGDWVVAVRQDGRYQHPRMRADYNGLIVLGRDDLVARAYVPIKDDAYLLTDQLYLSTQGFLDDETVLLEVTAVDRAAGGRGAWALVAWNFAEHRFDRVTSGPPGSDLTGVVPQLLE